MTRRKTAGKRLVDSLSEMLGGDDDEWTEQELATLGLIEATTDRIEVLRRLFDVEVVTLRPGRDPNSEPMVSTRRVSELGSELRQCESNVARWIAALRPDPTAQQPKSKQHQNAANTRWYGGAHQDEDRGRNGTTPTLTVVQ